MEIVERRDGGGGIQGGNAAVTHLNCSGNFYAGRNKIKGPKRLPGRDTPATVGIIDFQSVGGPTAFNVQISRNKIDDFDTAIFVSSNNAIIEENDVKKASTGISMGQGASGFNAGTDPLLDSVVKQNKVKAEATGFDVGKGSRNLLLENDVKGKDVDIILDAGATDNLVRGNKAKDITDDGTGNTLENNN